jgi:hypothetical protein
MDKEKLFTNNHPPKKNFYAVYTTDILAEDPVKTVYYVRNNLEVLCLAEQLGKGNLLVVEVYIIEIPDGGVDWCYPRPLFNPTPSMN